MPVRPVQLPVRRPVVLRIRLKRFLPVRPCQPVQLRPARLRHLDLRPDVPVRRHGPVTGEHPFMLFSRPIEIRGVLAVAEQESIIDPRLDAVEQVAHRNDVHHPLDLEPRNQPQRDRRYDPEQPVTPDRQREQFRVLAPAARPSLSRRIDDHERFDRLHHRRECQPAAMDVRRQRTSEAHAVHARLLLANRPDDFFPCLLAVQVLDQLRPLDPGPHFHRPFRPVEPDDVPQLRRIDEQ